MVDDKPKKKRNKTESLYIRYKPDDFQALKERAASEGYATPHAWAAALIDREMGKEVSDIRPLLLSIQSTLGRVLAALRPAPHIAQEGEGGYRERENEL